MTELIQEKEHHTILLLTSGEGDRYDRLDQTQEKTLSIQPSLLWEGRVVLDFSGEVVREYDLPEIISLMIVKGEARLEAMLRSNSKNEWNDVLALILCCEYYFAETPETRERN